MLPAILAQVGIPVLIKALSEGLKYLNTSLTNTAAEVLDDVQKAMTAGEVSPEAVAEANRHIEKMAELDASTEQTTLTQINQSIRAEVASSDAYVRRMRPTFGYIMALTWAAQMFGLAFVMVAEPQYAGELISAMSSLGMIWTVGLSVLGIYVYKRSEEKKQNG